MDVDVKILLLWAGAFGFCKSAQAFVPDSGTEYDRRYVTENTVEGDSVRSFMIGDIIITADPKTSGSLTEQPFSYSLMGKDDIDALGVKSLKNASAYVPNLYMPDYGSRLTSAIYIRGIGSRINSPAVGLYVDDAPCMDKSTFDFNFLGIDRIEVLRGPQSTLYGRNTMGGLIKVYSRDPRIKGTEIKLGGSTKDGGRYIKFFTSHPLTEKTSFSAGGFYNASDGFNRNEYLNKRSNGSESAGGSFRWLYDNSDFKPLHSFKADFKIGFEYSDEDGYDYYYTGNGADEDYKEYVGKIVGGELGGYRRNLLNSSLKLETTQPGFIFSSVTSYQFFNDRMFMDQDFSPLSIFTIEQKQRSHSLSEEIVFKSNNEEWKEGTYVDWTGGAFLSYQSLNTNAPVTFGADGIQSLIQDNIDAGFSAANAAMGAMGMNMAMTIDDNEMVVDGDFDSPVLNTAAFGQATIRNLFTEGLDLTAGLRLDYEHTKLDYNSGATSNFTFKMTRAMQGVSIPMYNYNLTTDSRYRGTIKKDYTQLLPKVALTYRIERDNIIYATVSKGFRSGGYNIQMFSDLIQSSLQNDMMRTLAEKIPTMTNFVTISDNPSADSTMYKPEKSWNYEVGTHLSFLDGRLRAEAALFFVDTRDQQIARYADSGLGRKMVNAGHSQSYGVDLSVSALATVFNNPLHLMVTYGYTHATFKDYDAGSNDGEDYVYDGNYVPYTPLHNFSVAGEYKIGFKSGIMKALLIGANVNGVGKIYWTEANDVSQPFYALLNAHMTADFGIVSVNLWGKNLTSTSYVPFYFESMNKGFAQKCRPLQLGIDVSVKF